MKIEEEIKSKFRSDEHKLLVNLHLTSTRLTELFHRECQKYDITATQFNVLRILRGQGGKAVSIGLIKERMIDRNSDMSRIIERLKKKGLIACAANKIDKRQKDVRISKKGLALLTKMDGLELHYSEIFNHMSGAEISQLNQLLDKARSGQK
jgi:DNA-binding MarR family transcriptional regulator